MLDLEYARDGDRIVATYVPKPEHRGAPGRLHGGLAATCLDETMAALGWMLDRVHTVTGTLELKYRKPIPIDSALTCVAWRDRLEKRRSQRVHGRLMLPGGDVAVEATGIFVQVKGLGDG